jgi:two-component system, OmpR family, response regulator
MHAAAPNHEAPHLLIVEDARDLREPLVRYLKENGYRVTAAENAAAARKLLKTNAFDLVITDIMMPGEDGLSLARHVRETSAAPLIFLTARGEEVDRVVGLELGADDYVVKPFYPREVLARIAAVLRRAHAPAPAALAPAGGYRFDRWRLDAGQRELIGRNGVALPLSTGEFRLLMAFLERPRLTLTRDQLLDLARGRDAEAFDRAIDNAIVRLRKKIEEDPKNPRLIKTVWGGGYVFAADVTRE